MIPRRLLMASGLALMVAGCGGDGSGPGVNEAPAASGSQKAAEKPGMPEPSARVSASPKPRAEPVGEPIDPLRDARADFAARRLSDAVSRAEAVLKENPKNIEALLILIQVTQSQGSILALKGGDDRKAATPYFIKSAAGARKLRDLQKKLSSEQTQAVSMAIYNEACSLAIDGQADAAIKMLKESVDAGFAEKETFATDPELRSLRGRPEFAELAARMGLDKTTNVLAMLKENKPFPFAFKLTGLDGKPISTEDLKGKVVIVDLWGTWCAPCRKQVPLLAALYEKYHDQGLEIVGINCHETGANVEESIKRFVADFKVPYRCALSDDKVELQVPNLLGFPTVLFLDRSGAVRLKVSEFDPKEKEILDIAVKLLLNEE